MAGRHLKQSGLRFEDVKPGDWYDTGNRRIGVETIDAFAELSGDRFEIHMSEEAARRHGFDGRVAHGLLVLSVVDGLKNQAEARFEALASLGWEWRFAAPVLAGDMIGARITVHSKRETRNRERGIVELDFDVTNQHGETVQVGRNRLMVYRRS